jgi:hypothetical protein
MFGRLGLFLFYVIEIADFILRETCSGLIHIPHFCTLAPACQAGGKMIINRERSSVQ